MSDVHQKQIDRMSPIFQRGYLGQHLRKIQEVVREVHDDHALYKTLTDELHDDHALYKILTDELHDDHATIVTFLGNLKTFCNNLRSFLAGDNITVASALSAGSTPENIATTAFNYQVNGTDYAKAAVAAGTAFTAANTINVGAALGQFWGIWLLQITAAGTISTKSPAADQVYADEATAIAALPAVDTDNVSVGYVTVQSNVNVDWVAQIDDLVAGIDCAAVRFYNTASGIPAAIADTLASITALKVPTITASKVPTITASKPGETITAS